MALKTTIRRINVNKAGEPLKYDDLCGGDITWERKEGILLQDKGR